LLITGEETPGTTGGYGSSILHADYTHRCSGPWWSPRSRAGWCWAGGAAVAPSSSARSGSSWNWARWPPSATGRGVSATPPRRSVSSAWEAFGIIAALNKVLNYTLGW